jgi:predicted transglutaminase-like cysteine proteinase
MVRITIICMILSGCSVFSSPIKNNVKMNIGEEVTAPTGHYQFCINTPNGIIC